MFSIRSCTLVISSSLMGLPPQTVTLRPYCITAGLAEGVEEPLRGLQLGGAETLGEPGVNWGQELAGLVATSVLLPKPSQAHCASQLHGQDPLLACPVQRLPEVLLRRGEGTGAPIQLEHLGLQPQQLGDAPELLVPLGSGERLVDRRE